MKNSLSCRREGKTVTTAAKGSEDGSEEDGEEDSKGIDRR